MGLKRSDVQPGDIVHLFRDCYREVAAPGVPQQVMTIGDYKASEIPDFAFERGYVRSVAKPIEDSSASESPAPDSSASSKTAKQAKSPAEAS